LLALLPRPADGPTSTRQKDIVLVSLAAIFPVACQVIGDGPAFTGLRHFTFVIPSLAVLAGIGFDGAVTMLATRYRAVSFGAFVGVLACFAWNAVTLVMLHPYEYLFYNPLVGGLKGASRRYDLDYWFDSMPESVRLLESYLQRTEPVDARRPLQVYPVAVCGERLSFEHILGHLQPRFDFTPRWDQSQFFIAPTQMNCDRALDGRVIGIVERLGVPIAYVKDRRALTQPIAAASRKKQQRHDWPGSSKTRG
jgi:hypothetical protein